MNSDKLAYLAGIVDGEGTIQLSNPYLESRGSNQMAYICIVNSGIRILAECQSTISCIIGKPVKLYDKAKSVENGLDMYTITIPNKLDLYKILKAIRPYLTEKQDKCDAVIRVLEMRGLDSKNKRYSEEFIQLWKDEWTKLWTPRTTKRLAPKQSDEAIV